MNFERYHHVLKNLALVRSAGKITRVVGGLVEGIGPAVSVGDLCRMVSQDGRRSMPAEVVGFREERIVLTPLGDLRGFGPGSALVGGLEAPSVPTGNSLLGRVVDAFGHPIDHRGTLTTEHRRTLYAQPPSPLQRSRIQLPLPTGVRAIDALITCGQGQRVGLFAGSGVGKSVLMGMIARNTAADVNVIALLGERGREIREFVEKDLQAEGLARSVVVAVPSDQAPMVRIHGAFAATSIAEYFRDQGKKVFLMMDSLTRVAMSAREIGLAAGEPPTSKGYTPSVFALLPKLLERAGGIEGGGSITGFYTVLMEGDDADDPIADAVRSILDGHIMLSRRLASRNQYPAIDVLESISRLMVDVTTPAHQALAGKLRRLLSVYQGAEDLISVGVYAKGSQPEIDDAIHRLPRVQAFLRQGINEKADWDDNLQQLEGLFL